MAVYALGFFGGNAATELLRERVKQDEDRFVRFNAAVALGRRGDLAAAGTLREMLSTADLSKVIDLSSDDRKAEQDRGDRARGDGGASDLDLERVGCTRQVAQQSDHRAVEIRPRQRSEPGAGTFAKFTKHALIYRLGAGDECADCARGRRIRRASSSRTAMAQAAEISQPAIRLRIVAGQCSRARARLALRLLVLGARRSTRRYRHKRNSRFSKSRFRPKIASLPVIYSR